VANDGAGARLGMAVSTRAAGQSVNRNRLRRLIRESFRMHREELPAVDVLVTARSAVAKAANREVFESLARFWRAIGSAP
jgi:ribonuclease P protein component